MVGGEVSVVCFLLSVVLFVVGCLLWVVCFWRMRFYLDGYLNKIGLWKLEIKRMQNLGCYVSFAI